MTQGEPGPLRHLAGSSGTFARCTPTPSFVAYPLPIWDSVEAPPWSVLMPQPPTCHPLQHLKAAEGRRKPTAPVQPLLLWLLSNSIQPRCCQAALFQGRGHRWGLCR